MMANKPKKPVAPEAEKYPRKTITCQSGESIDEKGRSYASLITSPDLAAYRVIGIMQPKNLADEIDAPTMLATLRDQAATVQRGDLSHAEAMLINQASALQALFVRLSEKAMEQSHMPNLEGFMRMALRAQSQCRATLETLAAVKNPPVVIARQANIAHGPQQVNNGPANPAAGNTRAVENEIQQNELLAEVQHGTTVDIRATGPAIGNHPAMEIVGKINGAANTRG
jgi:hypothetical protein